MTLYQRAIGVACLLLALSSGVRAQQVPCDEGRAGGYACSNIDLLGHLPIPALDADVSQDDTTTVRVNDIWGWTDPQTGREYALVGRKDGVAMVDVTDPEDPVYMANLPKHTADVTCALQRDIKVYQHHAYVVAELCPNGLQVFDLTQVRSVDDPPVVFSEAAFYGRFGDAHNIFINTQTGFAYAVGISRRQDIPEEYPRPGACGSGLHMINIQQPENPQFAGCHQPSGYVHDVQCVVYRGPDASYQGREICISSSVEDLSISDVTDKSAPALLTSVSYPTVGYVHQGWLTEDQRYFIQNDEADESNSTVGQTTTYIWDLLELDAPELLTSFEWPTTSIDHNLYVADNLAYASNYTSGLRLLDLTNIQHPQQVGFFDTYPQSDAKRFDGTWSNYPFFASGTIAVSDISNGLFLLKASDGLLSAGGRPPVIPETFEITAPAPNPFTDRTQMTLVTDEAQHVTVTVYNVLGERVAELLDVSLAAGEQLPVVFAPGTLAAGAYFIRIESLSFVAVRPVVFMK